MGANEALGILFLIMFQASSHGLQVLQVRYKKSVASPNKWPGYFYDSIPLKPDQTSRGIICGTHCHLDAQGCGVFLVRDNICYLGSITNTLGSIFTTAQTQSETVFINPSEILTKRTEGILSFYLRSHHFRKSERPKS